MELEGKEILEFNRKEIQVFVSCPSDVKTEKEIVEKVCKDLTESFDNYCKVSFRVKEWQTIIGEFGKRPQSIINEKIGSYDIYFGIWWMRFGSKTGGVNPTTGEDFQSGTEEEFYLAFENWKQFKIPKIFLFFRDPKVTSVTSEIAQLHKVTEFRDKQQTNGWTNQYPDVLEFQRMVQKALNEKLLAICFSNSVEQKNFLLSADIVAQVNHYRINSEPPIGYVKRSIIHFKSIEKQQQIFNEVKQEQLEKLIQSQKRIIVLGDAGSGKTTELKNLAYVLDKKESAYLPIYKQLNSYTPEEGIEKFLPDYWKKFPPNLLVLILDGLDEIQPNDFNKVVRQIINFSERNPDLRIVISSRTNFYELPVNNSPGTLVGFEPYFISDIKVSEAQQYYSLKFSDKKSESFINTVSNQNLADLLRKPFFLMMLADTFSKESNFDFNRNTLYEKYLLARIELDKSHFKGTFDIREKETEIIQLLERVALSMEILAKNTIIESELLQLISSTELTTLKYCTAFNKKDGLDNIWQFEHNNLQEYLAAKALSKLEFDKVIKFISFEPSYKKLIPSWVNTLTFLISILDKDDILFKELIKWITKNEKEIVVKFEREKISTEVRNQLFMEIFNHYKSHDIWINSNKFDNRELAKFGQSDSIIIFLQKELSNKNSRTVKMNAADLLGHFEFTNSIHKTIVTETLLSRIVDDKNDSQMLYSYLNALRRAKLIDEGIVTQLMNQLKESNNQYIRSALYKILLETDLASKYIDYLIEGYSVIDKQKPGRESVNLFDEQWNLESCLKSIKTPVAVKKIINYIIESHRFDYGHRIEDMLIEIIENAVDAYKSDDTVYDEMLNWFEKEIRHYRDENIKLILSFFDKTGTKERAFYQIWKRPIDKEKDKFRALAFFATRPLLEFVIEAYLKHEIKNADIQSIYYDLRFTRNPEVELFEKLIRDNTKYEIQKPIDYNEYNVERQRKQKEDFELIFHPDKFLKETLRIFEEENKEEFTLDELFQVRKKNFSEVELDEYYSNNALRLLRGFEPQGSRIPVKKENVLSWFNKHETVKWYSVQLIFEYLTNDKNLELTLEQKEWIINWCNENIHKIDFKRAISKDEKNQIFFNRLAIYIFYFSWKFNITHEKNILLDMLSFDYYKNQEFIGVDHIIKKLPKEDVTERILKNLKEGVIAVEVLKNYFKYLCENKVDQGYPLLLGELINMNRRDYSRIEMLDIYFEATNDVISLKKILKDSDWGLKWKIVEKLIATKETSFVEEYLLAILKNKVSNDEALKSAAYLIKINNVEGIKYFLQFIEDNNEFDFDLFDTHSISLIKTKNAIPYLIRLLELDYQKKIKIDRFNRFDEFHSILLSAFFNIAYDSEENFIEVRKSLDEFRVANLQKYKNINYLQANIETMESQYYMNKAQRFTIKQVKDKLKLISQ